MMIEHYNHEVKISSWKLKMTEGAPLLVPILNSDGWCIEVPITDIPNPDDVLDILQGEIAPLGLWLDFAVKQSSYYLI